MATIFWLTRDRSPHSMSIISMGVANSSRREHWPGYSVQLCWGNSNHSRSWISWVTFTEILDAHLVIGKMMNPGYTTAIMQHFFEPVIFLTRVSMGLDDETFLPCSNNTRKVDREIDDAAFKTKEIFMQNKENEECWMLQSWKVGKRFQPSSG